MERGKRGSTSRPERLAMLEFLRIPDNFNLLTGQATKGKAMRGGQKLTRAHGHARLAEYVNEVLRDTVRPWTTQDARSRYDAYVKSYRRAVHWGGPNKSGRGLTDFKKNIFTIESKLDAICPLYNEMDALFGERQNFRPSYILETSNDQEEESRHADYSSVDLGSDDEDANHDPHDAADDPDTETYWARNDADDPGRAPADDDDPGHAQAQPSKRRSKPVLPRKFPTAEKRLTPRKDFSAIYMDVQSQATQLEREKFEYMKANDKDARATAAALNIRQAKASLVEKLVASGVVDPETIRELVSIAFEQD
ncbi:hypothetical protein AaE_016076 [Aphanomyces astaci]|uniref:Uncharacterized protein n=2 Tax=Aphanomyces astaci TaxID=112090 RepID=A0A6A4YUD0_APHAT|nr:hypothetical protein AaE_016076 [Aphanomyces astaci]